MKIPLRNFEQLIDPTILKRGLTYYKKGLVLQEGEGRDGELSFFVQGTNEYEVTVVVDREIIIDYTCDCPYTDGPVCKHITAVIFHLTQDTLQLNEPGEVPKKERRPRGRPKSTSREIQDEHLLKEIKPLEQHLDAPATPRKRRTSTTNTSKKVSIKVQIDDILQGLSPEELKHYLVHHVLNDKTRQADFLAVFGAKNAHESVETYRRQIKTILSSAKGRQGFIDYRSAGKVGSHVFTIAYRAITHTENGNDRSAMFISMAVLEEMTKALQFVDDSDGDVGSNLEIAYGVLSTLSQKPLQTELRQRLFDYAVEKYQSGEYEGWDWHLGMVEIALNLILTEKEETLVLNLLNQPAEGEYDLHRRQSLIYSLLSKRKDTTEAQHYLAQHLSNPALKKTALQKAFESHDFERVRQLAIAAIEEHKNAKPGLLSEWYDWLIKAAEGEGDSARIIEYARLQLLDHGRDKMPYFQIIKKYTPLREWRTTSLKLIEEMSVSRNWQTRELIPEILLEEQDWNNLFGYLQHEATTQGYNFDRLARYAQHLIPMYKIEIGELLQVALVTSAHASSKRRDYVDLTKDLRTMKKLGYGEIVHEIVQKLMAMYRHRPAMMEELRKV